MTRGWWSLTWLVARRELRARARARSARIFTAILLVAVAAAVVVPALVGGGHGAKRAGVLGPDRAALARTVRSAGRVLDTKVRAVAVPDLRAARAGLRGGSLDAVLVDHREVLVKRRPGGGVGSATDSLAVALAQLARTGRVRAAPPALPVRGLGPPPPSLTPGLSGKVIGMGLLALAQIASALVVLVALGLAVDSPVVHGASAGVVGIGALWFVLGYAALLHRLRRDRLAAQPLLRRGERVVSGGEPADRRLRDLLQRAVRRGDGGWYRVLAFLPPTAPVAMPTIYAIGAASAADIAISAAITVAATVAMAWLGGLVYQRAILRTGERVRLRQVP